MFGSVDAWNMGAVAVSNGIFRFSRIKSTNNRSFKAFEEAHNIGMATIHGVTLEIMHL
jgi:DhnA family fructose-bisphosphate aldolase class Ia